MNVSFLCLCRVEQREEEGLACLFVSESQNSRTALIHLGSVPNELRDKVSSTLFSRFWNNQAIGCRADGVNFCLRAFLATLTVIRFKSTVIFM